MERPEDTWEEIIAAVALFWPLSQDGMAWISGSPQHPIEN